MSSRIRLTGESDQPFSAAGYSGANQIALTIAGTAIVPGDIITVSYTAGTVTAQDTGVLASFTNQAVTNNKSTPPTFTSAATNLDGSVITITFNKFMNNPTGKHSEFSYKVNGGADQPFSAAGYSGANQIALTIAGTAIVPGDIITVSYTAGTVTAQDTGVLASFTDQAVTNNKSTPPTFTSAATNLDGSVITITFNKFMNDPTGKHGEFSYKVNGGADQPFSAAGYSGANQIALTTAGHGDCARRYHNGQLHGRYRNGSGYWSLSEFHGPASHQQQINTADVYLSSNQPGRECNHHHVQQIYERPDRQTR